MSSPSQEGDQHGVPGQQSDVGDANMNSILAIADDLGHIHCFLDGTYPLGAIPLCPETSTPLLFKHPNHPIFLAHAQKCINNAVITELRPIMIELPLLRTRKPRDLAKLSTTACAVWFGSDTFSGARELGPKWIRALETKQKDQFGRESNCLTWYHPLNLVCIQSM
jgi:anaphase-promoting complex subunit 4